MNCRYKNIANLNTINSIVLCVLCLVVMGVLLPGCDQPSAPSVVLINPLDSLSSVFIKPVSTISGGPTELQTITVSSVTFTWAGTVDVLDYSYEYDAGNWLGWSSQTSVTLDYLDEGQHSFAVRARHRNGKNIELNPPHINFTVDAVKGPSLMFLPRRKYALQGQAFTYDIKAEEVSFIYGTKISIQYDPSHVNVTGVLTGALINANGSSIILPTIDSIAHTITIELATIGRSPKGVSGSGVLATLLCYAKISGTTLFSFNSSQTLLRDTLNVPITPNTLVQGRVEIQ
jgi:hypothetical protein